MKCLTIVRQSLAIVRYFFRMTKYTQKFKLDLIQEYLDTGCSQRWIENKYSLPKDTLKNVVDCIQFKRTRRVEITTFQT